MIARLNKIMTGKTLDIAVWVLRVAVGAVFVMSGLVKSIDLWGFCFKIEEYLVVWNVDMPQSLCLIAALLISSAEFILGMMLAVGAYRRSCPWLLTLMMVPFMLPLSVYIFIADPVADCGCFGDFWHISNGATLLKNVIISAALIILVIYNKRVKGLYRPYTQWIPGIMCFAYIIGVGLWGYNVQPPVDFRSFPEGTSLVDEESEDVTFDFVYEKDNVRKSFTADNLPDSTWTFVDRVAKGGEIESKTDFVVYDGDDEVGADIISEEGPQILIVVPDHKRANISYTYSINELQRLMEKAGGSLVEITSIPEERLEWWRDMSMASYPIYTAESTMLKELSRGVMSAVYMEDGKIIWKRTLSSIDIEELNAASDPVEALESLKPDGGKMLLGSSLLLLAALLLIMIADRGYGAIKSREKHSHSKKMSNFVPVQPHEHDQ